MTAQPGNIVLVHGAYHGGWCWRRVADRLQRRGHRVFTPTLTGLADRAHLLHPDVTLSTHVQDVVNLFLWEDLEDVVLCGHSYGGMVITGVAEQLAQRIRTIVYLDALKPEAGRCLLDYADPAARPHLEAAMRAGPLRPLPATAFNVNEADLAWVDAKMTPHPPSTFTESLPSVQGRECIARKIYIYASGYDSHLFRTFAEETARDPSWRCLGMDGGHDLMIDSPDDVAAILDSAASDSVQQ